VDEVIEEAGLPPLPALSAGEQKMIGERGAAAFASSRSMAPDRHGLLATS